MTLLPIALTSAAALAVAPAVRPAELGEVVRAERAFARALGGSCHSPIGALAQLRSGEVRLRVEILSEDGREQMADEARFAVGDDETPAQLARDMLARAPDTIRRLFAGR